MPMATNYEFGGPHIYDSFEEALENKNKMVEELTEKFGPKSIFVKRRTSKKQNLHSAVHYFILTDTGENVQK